MPRIFGGIRTYGLSNSAKPSSTVTLRQIKDNTNQIDHGLAHGDIHRTHERSPFVEHLLGGVRAKIRHGVPDDGPEGVVHATEKQNNVFCRNRHSYSEKEP